MHGKTAFSLAAGEISDFPISVAMLVERASSSSQRIVFEVADSDDPHVVSVAHSRFVAPLNR
ncbi:hypothetical protein D3C75_1282360 [compost metagenome]